MVEPLKLQKLNLEGETSDLQFVVRAPRIEFPQQISDFPTRFRSHCFTLSFFFHNGWFPERPKGQSSTQHNPKEEEEGTTTDKGRGWNTTQNDDGRK